ncbi:ligand-binding sensor domain-containing protein [Marinilabilia salmonicolor]|uniref:Ligand-binding sensor domain-containing protein n=1 Tax=Marinilabilia salmonicolor TaxID=989 RepID=A0A368V4X4_9BACT|nr:ligand-binding sensor domain-containing protein [Marinilabilia salmonicolor]
MPTSLTVKKIIFHIFLVFLIPVSISSADFAGDFGTSQMTISDGLSNNSVTVIFQDSYGFLWIGTEDGLNRYDGYNYITYRHNPSDKHSISGNYIQCIVQGEDNDLWIGTRNNGLSRLDYSTGRFTTFLSHPGDENSLPENGVYGLLTDEYGDLWVKTQSFVSVFKGDSIGFENYGHFNNVFNVREVISYPLLLESDSSILVGTKDGLNRFNTETRHFSRLRCEEPGSKANHESVLDLVRWKGNTLLLACSSGLNILRANLSGHFEKTSVMNFPADKMPDANDVLLLKNGNLVVGTGQGLFFYDQSSDGQGFTPGKKLFESYDITSVFEDRSGIIWAGTRFNGVLKVNPAPPKVKTLPREVLQGEAFGSLNFQSVFQDNKGNLWLGTIDSGIYKYNPTANEVRNYPIECRGRKNTYPHAVYVIFEDDEGVLWAGTNCGLYSLDDNSDRFEEFRSGLDFGIDNLIKTNHIYSLSNDFEGNLWIGTGFGLYRFDGRYVFSHFFDEKEASGLYSDHINALTTDEEGNLWIGTSGGLNVWDRDTKQIGRVPFLGNDSIGIRTSILSLELAYNGDVWVGTRSGVWTLDPEKPLPELMEGNRNLENDMIQSVVADHTNRAWVSTNKGISCLNPDGTVFNFDVVDGLPGYVFNQNSVFKNREGTLFFGGTRGVCWFHPDSLHYNLNKPPLAITRIGIVRRGKESDTFWPFTDEISFKYRAFTSLEIGFSALEFTQPGKNRYRVFLEGYDSEWRPVTRENSVSFSNLLPGEYTLKLVASNNDFTWNNDPLELKIIVTPPLWMSNYALAFYILALIFVLHLFVNYRVRHYRKANRELQEKTVNKNQIEAQREVLTRINRSFTDSINYARRIQKAMTPSEASFSEVFSDSFVYLRARDIVSGDFFWFHEKGEKVFVAAVDCTGHGVPGAFMSIIGIDLLKNIVEVQGVESPAEILKTMNGDLIRTLHRQQPVVEEEGRVNDGMDMSLIVIDRKKKTLEFSGAYNGFYLVRDNEIHTYKGDRFPVGYLKDGESPVFTRKEVFLKDDDVVYLFSDGLPDQFGGPDHKKFKYRRFRLLLLHIHNMAFNDQKRFLHQKTEEWMEGAVEQVDDMLVIGFKPLAGLKGTDDSTDL